MEYHGIKMMGDFETDNIKAKDSTGIVVEDYTGNDAFTIENGGKIKALDGTSINEFSTDETLAGDSDDALVTEKAINQHLIANYQPLDINLTEIAALTPTSCYFIGGDGSVWETKSPSEVRTCLGLGSAALRAAEGTLTDTGSNLPDGAAIKAYCDARYLNESSNLSDLTDLPTARVNLELEIGVDVLAFNQEIQDIADMTPASNTFIIGSGSTWAARTPAQARTSLGLTSNSVTTHYHDSRYYKQSEFTDGTIDADLLRLKISTTEIASGYLYAGSVTEPTHTSERLNFDGDFYASRVFNAVYNDIADFQPLSDGLVYGKCYYETPKGAKICKEKCQKAVIGIASDTFGYGLGANSKIEMVPIAVAGWVLAYVDKEYEPGTPLTSDKFGNLTEMNLEEKRNYPERMVAVYSRKEEADMWKDIKVNGRHWVKIK